MDKVEVYTTFDTSNWTWNLMSMSNDCLFYGSIDELDEHISMNEDKYTVKEG